MAQSVDTGSVQSPRASSPRSPISQAKDIVEKEESSDEEYDDGRGVSVTPPREREPRPDSDEDYQVEDPASSSESEEQEEGEQEAEHEDSSPDQSDEEEEDLETKYQYVFSHALRTEQGQMEFISRAAHKKLPKSDPTKSKKKITSLSSSAYINMRATYSYFSDDKEFIEPDCTDSRFHNDQQKGVYHEILSSKGFVDCSAIDWSALTDSRLRAVPSLIHAAGLEFICNIQQGYDPEIIREFYATVWVEQENQDLMIWRTRGQLLSITAPEFNSLFHAPLEP